MNHIEIIQGFIGKKNYKSFLEIGCDKNACFKAIVCDIKVGVDPERGGTLKMTSDKFFAGNKEKFDIIFIDGLHEADQVERDITNALECLNTGGTIVVHDLLPTNEEMQMVPRKVKEWTGDGWKAFARIKADRIDVEMFVIDTDYGCGIIQAGSQRRTQIAKNLTWEYFVKNKPRILGLVSLEEFKAVLQA